MGRKTHRYSLMISNQLAVCLKLSKGKGRLSLTYFFMLSFCSGVCNLIYMFYFIVGENTGLWCVFVNGRTFKIKQTTKTRFQLPWVWFSCDCFLLSICSLYNWMQSLRKILIQKKYTSDFLKNYCLNSMWRGQENVLVGHLLGQR